MAARRRPRKSPQGQLEDDLLKNQRWSGLKEQQRLQALLGDSAGTEALAQLEQRRQQGEKLLRNNCRQHLDGLRIMVTIG